MTLPPIQSVEDFWGKCLFSFLSILALVASTTFARGLNLHKCIRIAQVLNSRPRQGNWIGVQKTQMMISMWKRHWN